MVLLSRVVVTPNEGKLGPAMLALTDKQRLFVTAMCEIGGLNYKQCAVMAGYNGSDNTLRVVAHRLAHDERVLAAIEEEGKRRLKAGILMCTSRLLEIASNDVAQDKDKLKAIEMILNRSGLHALTESKVTHEHRVDDKNVIDGIVRLAGVLGIDPVKLLGSAGVKGSVVEGEFKVIDEDRPEEDDEHSMEGLEDV